MRKPPILAASLHSQISYIRNSEVETEYASAETGSKCRESVHMEGQEPYRKEKKVSRSSAYASIEFSQ